MVTRDEILRVVRGIDYDGLDRSIDARICRLRRKLHEAGGVGPGLAIVKSVAEWHGGAARIGPSPLGGARVSISW